MISVPSNIQYQLGDAIGVIADSDFWEKWNTLVDVCTRVVLACATVNLMCNRTLCPA